MSHSDDLTPRTDGTNSRGSVTRPRWSFRGRGTRPDRRCDQNRVRRPSGRPECFHVYPPTSPVFVSVTFLNPVGLRPESQTTDERRVSTRPRTLLGPSLGSRGVKSERLEIPIPPPPTHRPLRLRDAPPLTGSCSLPVGTGQWGVGERGREDGRSRRPTRVRDVGFCVDRQNLPPGL